MADEIQTVDTLVQARAAQIKENSEVEIPAEKKTEVVVDKPVPDKPDDKGGDIKPDAVADLLKEFNLESLDALKERLKPKDLDKVESPEEKEKRENLYRVEMQKYAVENGLMKPDEFVQLENIKAKDDRSLVFERWLPSWKEENPDADPADIDRLSKEDFETEYRLNSDNEKTKNRGIAKIAKEAKEVREPLERSYTQLKTDFDEDRTVKSDYPDFSKKVSGFIQENIPAKVKLFETKDGEDTVPVEIDLTDEQRKEVYNKVAKKIMNSSTYQLYKKGDMKPLQELAQREAEATIWADQRQAGLTKIAETFLKRGDEKGYKRGVIGAKNPFPLVAEGKSVEGKDNTSAANQVLDSLRGKT